MNDIGDLNHRIMELVGHLSDFQKYQLLRRLEDMQQAQNRKDHRQQCLIPVDISIQDRVYRDFIYNLSDSGAFIETRESFLKGEPLLLTFSAPDGKKHYKVDGIVIRNDVKGVAVRFLQKIKRSKDVSQIIRKGPLIQLIKGSELEKR